MSSMLLFSNQSHFATKCRIEQISERMSELGIEPQIVYMDAPQIEIVNKINDAMQKQCKFAFGFCGEGMNISDTSGRSIFDVYNIPYISMMIDPPYNPNSAFLHKKLNHFLIACYDVAQFEYLKWCFPANHFKLGGFVPSGTYLSNSANEFDNIEKRKIDVCFVGTNHKFQRIWKNNPNCMTRIYDDVVDLLIDSEDTSLLQGVTQVIGHYNIDLGNDLLKKLFSTNHLHYLDAYIRTERRNRLLDTIVNADIEINIFGPGWEKYCHNSNCHLHENGTDESVYSFSKIVLNENAFIIDGPHERVLNAMQRGAAVITDSNNYYREEFIDDHDIKLFTWKNLHIVPQLITELLSNPNKLHNIANSGQAKVRANHTYKNRADAIARIGKLYRLAIGLA